MVTLRTNKTEARYQEFLKQKRDDGCYLCKAPTIREFRFWKIVRNEYPYDKIATVNHILATKRHCDESRLAIVEKEELLQLKKTVINECYDAVIESTHKKKSIPNHFHAQLIEFKQEDADEPQAWISTRALEKSSVVAGDL